MRTLEESLARRDLLKKIGAASLAALGTGAVDTWARSTGDHAVEHPEATADSCILNWLAGGMAAPTAARERMLAPGHTEPAAVGQVRGSRGRRMSGSKADPGRAAPEPVQTSPRRTTPRLERPLTDRINVRGTPTPREKTAREADKAKLTIT